MTVEPIFDFEKGEFRITRNGEPELVTGKELLQTQIEKRLRTEAGRFRIYEQSGYGTRIEQTIIGKNLPHKYMISELERCIKESVLCIEGVLGIDGFEMKRSGSRAIASFHVQTIYGNWTEGGIVLYG